MTDENNVGPLQSQSRVAQSFLLLLPHLLVIVVVILLLRTVDVSNSTDFARLLELLAFGVLLILGLKRLRLSARTGSSPATLAYLSLMPLSIALVMIALVIPRSSWQPPLLKAGTFIIAIGIGTLLWRLVRRKPLL